MDTASEMVRVTSSLVCLAVIACFSAPARSDEYPARTVKIIVPFGAGGPADLYARVVAQHLSDALKQSFVVDDRPGAGAIIGTSEVAKAAPDGYTLLIMSNTHTVNETILPNKPYSDARPRSGRAGEFFRSGHGGAPFRPGKDSDRIHRVGESTAGSS